MQATIRYTLSEAGQKAALKAGKDAQYVQTIAGEIEERDFAVLQVKTDGTVWGACDGSGEALNLPHSFYHYKSDFAIPPASIREVLDAMHQAVAENNTKYNELMARTKAEKQQELLEIDEKVKIAIQEFEAGGTIKREYYGWPYLITGDYKEAYPENTKRYSELRAVAIKRVEDEQREKQEAAEKAEQLKKEEQEVFMRQWALANLAGEELEQYNDDLFPRHELLSRMAASVLDSLGSAFSYRVCKNTDHACYRNEIHSLPTARYKTWKAIERQLPEGSRYEFHEVASCLLSGSQDDYDDNDDGIAPVTYFVALTVPLGPFHFERKIELD